jgi:hypothetical protein
MNRLRRNFLISTSAAFAFGCVQASRKTADGGMSGTGSPVVTIGTVTQFGSVVVNGFVWDTDSAQVIVNGKPGTVRGSLHLGMIVRVEGARPDARGARGTARKLQYDADLIGPLDRSSVGVVADGGSSGTGITVLKVAGQTIFTDTSTRFDGFTELSALDHNDMLEVSGYRDRAGLLHATWVGRIGGIEALGRDVRVKGIASEPKATQFKIGDLVILGANKVRAGDFVAVIGKWRVAAPELAASNVQVLPTAVSLPEGVPVIMEGLIRTVSAQGFTMHNRPIVIRASTAFERGDVTDLHEDGKVHVEGIFNGGILDAARIVIAGGS